MKNILFRFFSLFLCFTIFCTSLPVYASESSTKKTWDNIVKDPIGFFTDLFIEECEYLYSSASSVVADFKQVSKELYESMQSYPGTIKDAYESLPDAAKWGAETGLNALGGLIITYLREEVVLNSTQYRQIVGDVICNAATTVSNNGFVLKDWLESQVSINEATKKLTFSKELVNLIHEAIESALEQSQPYVLVDTFSPSEVPVSYFDNKQYYDITLESLRNLVDENVGYFVNFNFPYSSSRTYVSSVIFYEIDFSRYGILALYPDRFINIYDIFGPYTWGNEYYKSGGTDRDVGLINNDTWNLTQYSALFGSSSNNLLSYSTAFTKDNTVKGSQNYTPRFRYKRMKNDNVYGETRLYTYNGGHVKIWLDKTAFQEFSVGQQPYYVTTKYLNYDYSTDNSITVNGDYLVGADFEALNKQVYYDMSQTIINNNYTNDISEERLAEILDAILQVKDAITEGGGSGGSFVPSEGQKSFWDKVLDYLDKILKQLKQIKWFTLADLGLSVVELSDNIGDVIDDGTDKLAVGLETIANKFPFSIPWDIAAIITLLAAEPEIPHFEIPIVVEPLGFEHTIVIDLTDWVPLSKVSRFLLSALFLLYLLSLSRKMAVFFNQSMF